MVDDKFLQQIKLFGELKAFEWEELSKVIKEQNYVEGDVIFSEGDASTELYMVSKGEVEITIKIAPQLGDSTVYVVRPYDIFGEFAFVDPKPRSASARCTKDSTLAIMRRADFEDLAKQFPQIGLNFYRSLVRLLSERLRRMNLYLKETFTRCAGLEI